MSKRFYAYFAGFLLACVYTSFVMAEEARPLKTMVFESSATVSQIKFQATRGFEKVIEEKLQNPGRLILDFPELASIDNINLNQMTDKSVIPRVRIALKPDRLRIIIDTVVDQFPPYQISKTSNELILRIQKSPEVLQEALSKTQLFSQMQGSDRSAQLKLGSEDEGGLLFQADSVKLANAKATSSSLASSEERSSSFNRGGVHLDSASASLNNRVVFMLNDNKECKIFLEDGQKPVHIERICPGYEVKGVQARLNHLGYKSGLVDGDVGPQTKDALRQYQKTKGLAVTGTPNKKTQRELRKDFGY